MFQNLFSEIDTLRDAFGYGFLEALAYLQYHKDELDGKVRSELALFMGVGSEFFAEV